MPGGNSTARPYNRKEKQALKIMNTNKALFDQISDRFLKGDLSPKAYSRLTEELLSPRRSEAVKTLNRRELKESKRKERKYQGYKDGGAVKGYKGGGCVMPGRGGSYKGMK